MSTREPVREEDLRSELREVLVRRFGALRPGVEARIETASAKELDQFLECAASASDLLDVFARQMSMTLGEHVTRVSRDEFLQISLREVRRLDTLGFSDDEIARSLVASFAAIFNRPTPTT
jgi:hypothetical protein